MTPEEKLLRAIFGEKAGRARHLAAPAAGRPGTSSRCVFNRHGIDIDDRTRAIQTEEKERLKKDADDERASSTAPPSPPQGNAAEAGRDRGAEGHQEGLDDRRCALEATEKHDWWKIAVKDDKRQADLEALKAQYDEAINVINRKFEDRVEKLERGDELPPGVLKMVKVFVAVKRKLQPGDKMAGRHGNKGVISRILPQEDMPFLEDGTRSTSSSTRWACRAA